MQTVQKVTVQNSAGFNLSFWIADASGKKFGNETADYPSGQAKTLDLMSADVPEKTKVHPVIRAHVGGNHTKDGPEVIVANNEDNATYKVTGGYLNITVDLEGQ